MAENSVQQSPVLGVIGAGKVGCTVSRLLAKADYVVAAVYSPTRDHAYDLAQQIGAKAVALPDEVVNRAELILLTVPDDTIGSVVNDLAVKKLNIRGKAFIHTSGTHDREVLSRLAGQGALTGSLHPAFPFASVETAMERLAGAVFAVESVDDRLDSWLTQAVQALGGQVLRIPPGSKVLYHAALVIASNYVVTLYAAAQRLLTNMGAERAVSERLLNTLLAGTVENLYTQGIPDALTGPLVRGDVGTVKSHIRVLQDEDSLLPGVYQILARLSYPILEERHIVTDLFEEVLGKGSG